MSWCCVRWGADACCGAVLLLCYIVLCGPCRVPAQRGAALRSIIMVGHAQLGICRLAW
jgi:hypothetical protein